MYTIKPTTANEKQREKMDQTPKAALNGNASNGRTNRVWKGAFKLGCNVCIVALAFSDRLSKASSAGVKGTGE